AGRLAGFSFTGALDRGDVSMRDPAEGRPDLGGPLGLQVVDDSPLTIALLVNQFLTVERARDVVPPGEERLLDLTCRWELVAAARREGLAGSAPAPVTLALRVPLRRDDE